MPLPVGKGVGKGGRSSKAGESEEELRKRLADLEAEEVRLRSEELQLKQEKTHVQGQAAAAGYRERQAFEKLAGIKRSDAQKQLIQSSELSELAEKLRRLERKLKEFQDAEVACKEEAESLRSLQADTEASTQIHLDIATAAKAAACEHGEQALVLEAKIRRLEHKVSKDKLRVDLLGRVLGAIHSESTSSMLECQTKCEAQSSELSRIENTTAMWRACAFGLAVLCTTWALWRATDPALWAS
mmetsp:Transcript_42546/g.91842  ORF Transcript_42546/g.91842 Transcript_42546/m.91842 type:complete len:243 (+) Transcript_42546:104-832(+)